jgi:hypothetical protein
LTKEQHNFYSDSTYSALGFFFVPSTLTKDATSAAPPKTLNPKKSDLFWFGTYYFTYSLSSPFHPILSYCQKHSNNRAEQSRGKQPSQDYY